MSVVLAVYLIAGFGRDLAHPIVFEQYAGQLRLLQLDVQSVCVVHIVLLFSGPSFLLTSTSLLFEND